MHCHTSIYSAEIVLTRFSIHYCDRELQPRGKIIIVRFFAKPVGLGIVPTLGFCSGQNNVFADPVILS